jgi:hypothetical protein
MFITAFTKALHWSLPWARLIQSISPHPISLRSILMLSHSRSGLSSGLFPPSFQTIILYAFFFSPTRATCHASHIHLNLVILIISGEEYVSCRSSYETDIIENDVSNNSSILVCIHCRGNVFSDPLPNKNTHTDTQTDGRDLKSTPLRWAQVRWCTYQVS